MPKRRKQGPPRDPRSQSGDGRPWWMPVWVPAPLVNAWTGRTPLWIAFWVWGLSSVAAIGILAVLTEGIARTPSPVAVGLAGIAAFALWSRCVWVCARNTSWSAWTWYARVVVLGLWALLLYAGFFS